jgi:hypothetical protein
LNGSEAGLPKNLSKVGFENSLWLPKQYRLAAVVLREASYSNAVELEGCPDRLTEKVRFRKQPHTFVLLACTALEAVVVSHESFTQEHTRIEVSQFRNGVQKESLLVVPNTRNTNYCPVSYFLLTQRQ